MVFWLFSFFLLSIYLDNKLTGTCIAKEVEHPIKLYKHIFLCTRTKNNSLIEKHNNSPTTSVWFSIDLWKTIFLKLLMSQTLHVWTMYFNSQNEIFGNKKFLFRSIFFNMRLTKLYSTECKHSKYLFFCYRKKNSNDDKLHKTINRLTRSTRDQQLKSERKLWILKAIVNRESVTFFFLKKRKEWMKTNAEHEHFYVMKRVSWKNY